MQVLIGVILGVVGCLAIEHHRAIRNTFVMIRDIRTENPESLNGFGRFVQRLRGGPR